MAINFDGPNTLITFTGTETEVSAPDLYSRWKDWVKADNAGYAPAFRSIGGDDIGGGVAAGDYYFLNNTDGWRIRPREANYQLSISGNLYGEDPSLPIFTPTLGTYNVLITRTVSSLTQTAEATAILDEPDAIEPGLTLRQSLRLILATVAGKVSGAAGTQVTIRNAVADSKDRIIATVDASGNRTAIIYDLS